MTDFETAANDAETEPTEERTPLSDRFSHLAKYVMRRFLVLLSFGPGILGVLWLLGRILRR